jgi:hypothetical protein
MEWKTSTKTNNHIHHHHHVSTPPGHHVTTTGQPMAQGLTPADNAWRIKNPKSQQGLLGHRLVFLSFFCSSFLWFFYTRESRHIITTSTSTTNNVWRRDGHKAARRGTQKQVAQEMLTMSRRLLGRR